MLSQQWILGTNIQFLIGYHFLNHLTEHQAYARLHPKAQPEFNPYYLIIFQFLNTILHGIRLISPVNVYKPVAIGALGVMAKNRINNLLFHIVTVVGLG